MKKVILLFLFTFVSETSFTQTKALSPGFAAKMAVLADMLHPGTLPQDGKYSCEYDFSPANLISNSDKFLAFGKTMDEAHYMSILLCMKNQCETIGMQMEDAILQLRSIEKSALNDILQAQGIESKDTAQEKIKDSQLSDIKKLNCANGSQLLKEIAITPCVTTSRHCQKKISR